MRRMKGLSLFFLFLGCGTEATRSVEKQEFSSSTKSERTVGDSFGFDNFTRKHTETLTTKYPVVFHHGLCGYDKILFIDYYYKIPDELKKLGVQVFATKVAPVATIKVRAQQLAEQIDEILKKTGASKVNLIGHSMGGLDSRYLISSLGYGDRIASLTTLASPHQGTLISDLIYQAIRGGNLDGVLDFLESITGQPPPCKDLNERACEMKVMRSAWNIRGVAWNLSEEFMQKYFNPRNPPDPRVQYQSYSGIASRWGWPGRPPKVEEIFAPVYLFLKATSGDNDGLVPTASAVYGLDRGILPADHLDIIGHLMGETGGRYDHTSFFKGLVQEIQSRGF